MDEKYRALTKKCCEAIQKRQLLQFPYRSDNDEYPTIRKVEPYLVVIDNHRKGKIKMVGYQINRAPEKKHLGHYLFEKLDVDGIIVLDETFDGLRVDKKQ